MKKMTIVGAGAWGSVLAYTFNNPSLKVTLWSKSKAVADEINKLNKNTKYIGQTKLTGIRATTNLIEAIKDADVVINALPSNVTKNVFHNLKSFMPKNAALINASKGIDPQTHKFPFEIFGDIFPDTHYLSLSGPSFASGLLQNHPTTINIAGKKHRFIKKLNTLGKNKNIYLAFSNDVIGVEWGGIYKNVVAIAVGYSKGSGYGENTNALIFSSGFKEMVQAGIKMGADIETFHEPSGVGDLMMSATSMSSRNYAFGYYLAKGESAENIFKKMSGVIEGYYTLQSIPYLSNKYGFAFPLATMLYRIIFKKVDQEKTFLNFLDKLS